MTGASSIAPVRYGIVGAGYFGREFARILAGLPSATLAGVYSTGDATAFGADFDCPVLDSYEALLARCDAVIIASPNHAHRDYAVAAAEHGVAVFCEKPIALNYADCDAMVSSCERNGVLFLAGHVMHFMDGVRRAASLIADGTIGEPVVGRAVRVGWEDGTAAPTWKKTRALSGGHLFHHIHELDVLQHLMGAAETATMVAGAAPQAGTRVGDEDALLLATVTMPGHRYATLEWGSVFRRPEHVVRVEGTRGFLEIDMEDVGVTVVTGDRVERFPLHESAEVDAERTAENHGSGSGGGVTYGDPTVRPPRWLRTVMQRELVYFTSLLRGETPDPALAGLTDGTAARASIATAEALTRSAALGRTVAVSEVSASTPVPA